MDEALLDEFCHRWKIVKLELFGSMLAEPSSARDVDLLVSFAPDARRVCSSMRAWRENLPRSWDGPWISSAAARSSRVRTHYGEAPPSPVLCPSMSPNRSTDAATISDTITACSRRLFRLQEFFSRRAFREEYGLRV